MTFLELGIGPPLSDTLRRLGFERPTPIQEQSIPLVLGGRDLVGSAETGSGKTAAFLLPVIDRLLKGKRSGGTRALVLVPTRELAEQVRTVAMELSEGTSIGCAAVYGGVGMDPQTKALRGGVDIVVATPGRFLDHTARGATRMHHLEVLILDEADRMLDMGFMPDIRRILEGLPKKRQTLLFSATIPPEIAKLSREVLDNPERVKVGSERKSTMPVGITHAAFPVQSHRKAALLTVLLRRGNMRSVVVFCRTKHRADRLAKTLEKEGFPSSVLHGDRSQGQRTRALEAFRAGRRRILVATDLAARGLDVEGISHVVNFDFPRTPEDYIHRVGRTGRADTSGDAFALVTPEEIQDLRAVERVMGADVPRVTLPEFDYGAAPPSTQHGGAKPGPRGGGGGGGGGPKHKAGGPPRPKAHGAGGGGGGKRGGHKGGRGADDDRPKSFGSQALFWKRVREKQRKKNG